MPRMVGGKEKHGARASVTTVRFALVPEALRATGRPIVHSITPTACPPRHHRPSCAALPENGWSCR